MCGRRTLSATRGPSPLRARWTTPIPPSPSRARRVYSPTVRALEGWRDTHSRYRRLRRSAYDERAAPREPVRVRSLEDLAEVPGQGVRVIEAVVLAELGGAGEDPPVAHRELSPVDRVAVLDERPLLLLAVAGPQLLLHAGATDRGLVQVQTHLAVAIHAAHQEAEGVVEDAPVADLDRRRLAALHGRRVVHLAAQVQVRALALEVPVEG